MAMSAGSFTHAAMPTTAPAITIAGRSSQLFEATTKLTFMNGPA